MPDFVTDRPYQEPDSAWADWYENLPATTQAGFRAQRGQEATTAALGRFVERGQYETGFGGTVARGLAAAGAQEAGARLEDIGLDPMLGPVPAPTITAQEAKKRYPQAAPIFTHDMPEPVARMLADEFKQKAERDDVLRRYEQSHAWPVRLGTGLVAFMMDPLNATTALVPGVGEEAIAARIGISMLARQVARVGAGASMGAAGQVPLSAIRYGISDEAADYNLRDAFRDMFYGAAGGAVLHAGLFGGLREMGYLKPDRLMRAARGELPLMEPAPEPAPVTAPIAEPPPAIETAQVRAAEETLPLLGTEAERAEVRQLIDGRASKEEIKDHPLVQRAQTESDARPKTNELPGFGTPEFEASREFNFGSRENPDIVVGYDAAIDRLTAKARAYSTAAPVEQGRQATIVLGPPASGKSHWSEALATERRAAIVDPDDAKMALPEYDGGMGANAVHDESAEISTRVLERMSAAGDNLVLPRVGARISSIRKLAEALTNQGYQIDIVNMSVGPEEAYRRMIRRFLKTGRIIGSEYFDAVDGNPEANYFILKREGQVREAANIDGNQPQGVLAFLDGGDTAVAQALLRSRGGGGTGAGPLVGTLAGQTTGRFGEAWRAAQSILAAPASVQGDAARTAVSQILDGRPIDVTPVIEAVKPLPVEDTGGAVPPDAEVMVVRLGSAEGGLAGRNAGNVRAVAEHLVRTTGGMEGPMPAYGIGDTISVYGVTFEPGIGEYQSLIGGRQQMTGREPTSVGRDVVKGNVVGYSFPAEGAGYQSRLIARVPLNEVRARLRAQGYETPDDAGIDATERTIREVIQERARAAEGDIDLTKIAQEQTALYRDGFAQGIPQGELAEATERLYGTPERVEEREGGLAPVRPAEAAPRILAPEATAGAAPESVGAAIPSPIPNAVQTFRPDELIVDAKRFQFKEGGDIEGVTDRLKGVTTWDPIKAGMVLAWEDNQGRRFLVDGHQRMGLAKRIAAADPAQQPMLNGWLLREADGVSDIEAHTIAASKNIAEGTGTVVDAAKVLRDRPDLIETLPPRSELVRQARGLVNLSDEAFRMVVNEVVPPNYAAIVGRLTADSKMQEVLLGLLAKTEPANVTQAEAIVRQGLEAGTHVETQIGLFGAEDVATSLYLDRAKVLDRALKQLKRDKTVFSTIVKESDILESVGNVLAADTNIKRATQDAQALQILQTLASRKGPISDALSAAARTARDAGSYAGAVKEFVAAIRRQAESGDLARLADGLPRGAEHAGDEGAAGRIESAVARVEPGEEAAASNEVAKIIAEPGAEGLPQLVLPGAERSAVQAAAAREMTMGGKLTGRMPQQAPGGLFAPPPEAPPPDLFAGPAMSETERQLAEAEKTLAAKGPIHPEDRAAIAEADATMRATETQVQAYAQAAECLIEAGV